MKSKGFSVLVVGAGAAAGQLAYLPRLTQQIQRMGWQVHVKCLTTASFWDSYVRLSQLDLAQFDLILLMPGLCHPLSYTGVLAGVQRPENRLNRFIFRGRKIIARFSAVFRQPARIRHLNLELEQLLGYLRPFRRRLVLLTPFPHPRPMPDWFRKKQRKFVLRYGRGHQISVFDTATVIDRKAEYFSESETGRLSPVAADLLGQTLFEYLGVNGLLPIHPELRQRRD